MSGQVVQMSITEAHDWIGTVPETLTKQKNEIAKAILKEIRERLGFLVNVGLNYLTMSRNAGTLSGGEIAAYPAGQPDRFGPDRACFMCWTNPPSACTSATMTAC